MAVLIVRDVQDGGADIWSLLKCMSCHSIRNVEKEGLLIENIEKDLPGLPACTTESIKSRG